MIKKISAFFSAVIVTSVLIFSAFSVSAAGSFKTWLQSDSRWGSKTLGGSGDTMAEIGCAVTSVAIQMVYSGSMSESNFNPGTLVDFLNKNGGLGSEGDLYWGAAHGLASTFTYEKRAYISASSQSGIASEIASYIRSGYYVVMSVEYDCHWVAIEYVKDGVIYMMDPAQNKTNKLFDYYDTDGMLQVRLFKGKYLPGKNPEYSITPSTPTPTTNYLTGHYKTTDALNLRASSNTSSNILLTIPKEKTVVVTRINGNWGEIEYNGKSGWVCLDYTTYTESSYKYNTGNYRCNVTSGVNMRSGIGSDKSAVCLIPYNAAVTVSSVSNNWGKVTYGSKTGYVCMEYLIYSPATTTTANPVTTAPTTTTVKTTTTTTPSTSAPADVTTLPLKKGDINRDGKIDNDDVLALNLFINSPVKLEIADLYTHDVNSDSTVDEIDVVFLMKKIRNKEQ